MPTPSSSQIFVPADTYAVVNFEVIETNLISHCRHYNTSQIESSVLPDSEELCLAHEMLSKAMEVCKCYCIAAALLPENHEVCTPLRWKNCLTPRFMELYDM